MVYGRTIVEPGPSLDDDRLRAEDPDLWDEITAWPEPFYSLVADAIKQWLPMVSEQEVAQYLEKYLTERGLQKTLSDPNSWTDSQIERTSKYFVPGPVKVRLIAPRKATAEELGEE
jgi:hypothetical protein